MADNVLASGGALVVATAQDAAGVQHQKLVPEFLSSAGSPQSVTTQTPLPTETASATELLTAILVELRLKNYMFSTIYASEIEQLELKRADIQSWPVTL